MPFPSLKLNETIFLITILRDIKDPEAQKREAKIEQNIKPARGIRALPGLYLIPSRFSRIIEML